MTFWRRVSGGVRRIGPAVIFHGRLVVLLAAALLATGCDNSPYPESDERRSVYYTSFTEEPKHLDPARAYSTGDARLLGQCLEPPFQYHYLKRPYQMVPLTARAIPKVERRTVDFGGKQDKRRVYRIRIIPGIKYQNHACFVERNRHLTEADVRGVRRLADITKTATRELTAGDYIHAIRRLADPRLDCPIYAKLARNMLGMDEYRAHLDAQIKAERKVRQAAAGPMYNQEADEKHNPIPINYAAGADEFPFVRHVFKEDGKTVDKYAFEVVLSRPYPQILYWMAMNFFAPIPPEAIEFFSQPVLLKRSIKFDKNLVGTGPYKLVDYDPTNQIAFERNENFRSVRYPSLPAPAAGDAKARANYDDMKALGMLDDAGTLLPMIDRIVFRMEKESVPRWNKFLQGYYDASGISSDLFDEAVSLTSQGDANVSDEMAERGIRLSTSMPMNVWFYAFNMRDEVVGGYTPAKRKLRRAISIAINVEEYISIFLNGRGIAAQSPIAPGIYGHEKGKAGMNPFVYKWDDTLGRPVRRSLKEARQLLKEAGYENGYDADGRQLTIRYAARVKTADRRAALKWVQKQLEKLNIRLVIENTDYNQFTEKVLKGNYQMLHWGWVADYPDAENFLFLLYGPNAKLVSKGENTPNYENKEYDRLFEQMENMTDSPERLAIIRKMLRILQEDSPWVFDLHSLDYMLYHKWCRNVHPHALAYNQEKYQRLDIEGRKAYRQEYNKPIFWPLLALGGIVAVAALPAARAAARHFREV